MRKTKIQNFQSDTTIKVLGVMLALVAFAASTRALAEKGDWGEDESRWSVYLGVFWPDIDTSVQFRSETLGLGGSLIDFEEDLGLRDKDSLPIAGVRWRVAKRHTLELLYFQLARSGSQSLNAMLSFPCDVIDPANCMPGVPDAPNTCGENLCILDTMINVASKFDVRVIRLGYAYSIFKTENTVWNISGGIHADNLEVSLADSGGILGGAIVEDQTLPLPSIGLEFKHQFRPKWSVIGNFEWFGIEVSEYKGDLISAGLAVQWAAWEKTNLVFAWNHFEVDFEAGDSDFKGFFNWQYTGPIFALKYDF